MVGAEYVDGAVVALELLIVVSNVHAEIRRPSVPADQHAVFVVAESRRPKEKRAVFFVRETELAQAFDALADLAGFVQLAFALPTIVRHAESAGGALLLLDELVAAKGREIRQPLGLGRRDPAIAFAFDDAPRDGNQVLAGVAVGRQRIGRFEELAIARVDRTPERVELAARIVDDPFGEDLVAAKTHGVREGRADRHRAALHHDERAGRIRAAELERDARAVARRLAEALSVAKYLRDGRMPNRRC